MDKRGHQNFARWEMDKGIIIYLSKTVLLAVTQTKKQADASYRITEKLKIYNQAY